MSSDKHADEDFFALWVEVVIGDAGAEDETVVVVEPGLDEGVEFEAEFEFEFELFGAWEGFETEGFEALAWGCELFPFPFELFELFDWLFVVGAAVLWGFLPLFDAEVTTGLGDGDGFPAA